MKPIAIEGGCFCGSVRYRATAKPLSSMICHCKTCRRVAGAPVVGWVTFPANRFEFVTGEPKVLNSSAMVRREFCSACGTSLTYRSARLGDEVDVTTCSLDDPNAFPPTHHSWLSHDLSWVHFGDGLPTYSRSKNEEA